MTATARRWAGPADPTTLFDLMTFADVRVAGFRPERMPRAGLRHRILFVRTGRGYFAKLNLRSGDDLRIARLTTYAPDGTIVRTVENATIHSSHLYDVVAGDEVSSAGDLWWHCLATGAHYLEPVSGAAFSPVIGVDEIPFAGLTTASYRACPVDRSALRGQLLFCRTGRGRWAAMLVDAGDDLTIRRLITYDADGAVRLDRANLVLPRTCTMDLGTGEVVAVGGDLWWQAVNATRRCLTPVNGAAFSLPSYFRFAPYARLLDDPAVQTALVYQDEAGTRSYPDWTPVEKAGLHEYLYLLETGRDLPLPGPPPLTDGYLEPVDAWRIYLAHVGATQWDTILAVADWCRANLSHIVRNALSEFYADAEIARIEQACDEAIAAISGGCSDVVQV